MALKYETLLHFSMFLNFLYAEIYKHLLDLVSCDTAELSFVCPLGHACKDIYRLKLLYFNKSCHT